MITLKKGLKLSGSMVFTAVLSFFICISLLVIFSGVFTKEIGYNATVYEDEAGTKLVEEYTYYYTDKDGDGKDDGVDQKLQECDKKGYYIAINKVRSELEGMGKFLFYSITQVFTSIIIIAFASNSSYKLGFKESNLVRIGQVKQDYLRGLKIGLIGNAPFYILFIALIVMANIPSFKIPVAWYAGLNGHFYPLVMLIGGAAKTIAQLSIGQYILLFLLQLIVPAISAIAYVLGYKEISLSEKIMYKKEGK